MRLFLLWNRPQRQFAKNSWLKQRYIRDKIEPFINLTLTATITCYSLRKTHLLVKLILIKQSQSIEQISEYPT